MTSPTKLAAFTALALAMATPYAAHAQDLGSEPAPNKARAALMKILTPNKDQSPQSQEAGAASAARTRAKMEAFFHKTPGQAAHSTGQAALGAGAKAAVAAEAALLKIKQKHAEKAAAKEAGSSERKPGLKLP